MRITLLKINLAAASIATALCLSGTSRADVIAGPDHLGVPASNWVSGLEFQALTNGTLTSFIYQNQGNADTVVLTNSQGTILDTINTPQGQTSYTANVNWSLIGGQTYWLLQDNVSGGRVMAY